jgi:cytochrome c oxidase cbb3-type subunit 1
MGGVLFLIGSLIMVYNLIRTARGDVREEARVVEAAPSMKPAE